MRTVARFWVLVFPLSTKCFKFTRIDTCSSSQWKILWHVQTWSTEHRWCKMVQYGLKPSWYIYKDGLRWYIRPSYTVNFKLSLTYWRQVFVWRRFLLCCRWLLNGHPPPGTCCGHFAKSSAGRRRRSTNFRILRRTRLNQRKRSGLDWVTAFCPHPPVSAHTSQNNFNLASIP